MKTPKNVKPFGLELLTDVEKSQVNGGHHKKKPPIFHTMALSMPSVGHPRGDSF